MSLDWNLTDIARYEDVCYVDGTLNPVTHVLIFATVHVGMGEINTTNIAEFYARLRIAEEIDGPFLFEPDGIDRLVTIDDLKAHIGLKTNVSAESRAQWLRRYIGSALDQKKREYSRAVAERKAA